MNPITPVARHSVAVIGGGQAGLSISWYLTQSGVDHVVFEKERAGHAWRAERWELVLSRYAELAVPVAGLSVSRSGPARLHAAR